MLILNSTSDLVQVVTGGTQAIAVHASYADYNGTAVSPGRTNTSIVSATTTTVVGSPASSTSRTVNQLIVRNTDTSTADSITINHTDGSTVVPIWGPASLGPGYSVTIAEGISPTVTDANGAIVVNGNASQTGLILPTDYGTGVPTPPSGSSVGIFSRQVANRKLPAAIGPSGLDYALQPILARNKIGYWNPPGNATTVPGVFGITALTAQGTATARTVATTNLATRMRRIGYPSSSTAGTFAGARLPVAQFSCGSGANDGSGFFMVCRWVESDPASVSGRRAMVGMTASTSAPTNVEPNTLTNVIGVCQLSTDATQWYWWQGGSSAQSSVAIGTGIGAPAGNSTTAWELAIFAPNGVANTYYLQLTNLSTGAVATTTMSGSSAQVPQSSTLLAWVLWATNNATAAAVGQDLCSLYIETDN